MNSLTGTLVALSASGLGNTSVFLAAAAEETPSYAPYIQGGGSAMAVAGLVYVARMIVRGELVPRPVRESEQEMGAAILAAGQREAKVLSLAEAYEKQNAACSSRNDKTLVALTEVTQALRDVSREMEYWREVRQQGQRSTDFRGNR